MKPSIWHNFSVEKTLKQLKVNQSGLDYKEIEQRREKYGMNKLPEVKKFTWLEIFFRQFKNPLIYILIIAAIISLLLREYVDMFVILAALLISVVFSFFQEYKADKSLYNLKKQVKQKAKVIRFGVKKVINVENIVYGDLIALTAGDKVPADARIIESKNLQCVEALLTGESVPSEKNSSVLEKGRALADRDNMVYMGTTVSRGSALAAVVAIGEKTELGKIAMILKNTQESDTPLQQQIKVFSKKIGIITGILVLSVFILGLLLGNDFFEMLLTSVALFVAAIPEGVPASVTIILAIGMQRIFKEKGLIRQLSATETLGSTSVICTDKTGTLTLGILNLDKVLIFSREQIKKQVKIKERIAKIGKNNFLKQHFLTLRTALLASEVSIENPKQKLEKWKIIGDPIDKALLLSSMQLGLDKRKVEKEMTKLDELQFDEVRKYSASLNVLNEERNLVSYKGAPEIILDMCSFIKVEIGKERLSQENRELINKELEKLTESGLRVLAVAYKKYKKTDKKYRQKPIEKINKDLTFLGFVAFKDPLRKEARNYIKAARKAGIKTVIVTGDHRLTAVAIAKEIGLKTAPRNILEGHEMDKLSDNKLERVIPRVNVFARVEPKHKIRIIKAFQNLGEVVAMTGDGVNDAPAIKAADIGIAQGTGSDVTKEAADMVLLDSSFLTIKTAIEKGRVIFENIRKVTTYLMADSFSEILLIAGALLLGMPIPILPAQILWINLVENGLPGIALAFEPGEKEVMKDKPRKLSEPILNFEMKLIILFIGIIHEFILLGLFYYFWKVSGNIEYIRTIIFVVFGLDSLLYVFSIKSFRFTIVQEHIFNNKLLIFSSFIGLLLMLLAVYVPFLQDILRTQYLSFNDWILPIQLTIINLIMLELIKYFFIVKQRNNKPNVKTVSN